MRSRCIIIIIICSTENYTRSDNNNNNIIWWRNGCSVYHDALLLYRYVRLIFTLTSRGRKLFILRRRRRRSRYYYYFILYTEKTSWLQTYYNSTRDPVLIIIRITFNWTANPCCSTTAKLFCVYFFFSPRFLPPLPPLSTDSLER